MTTAIDQEAQEKLVTARVGLLLKHPFFGNMSTRMQLIQADDWCQTAATDGRNFFYSTEFVNKLSTKKLEFLIAHEICHCIFDHFGRTGSRNRQLSNIAQDYAINQILVDDRIGEKITEVDICLDSKYRGMAWEEIYDLLSDKLEEMSLDQLLDQLGDLLDEHLEVDNGDGSSDGEQGQEGNKRPRISKEDLQAIRDEIKEAMIQSAQAAGAGKLPAGIQRLIKDLTEPKMDWREVLRMNIQSIIRNDYSFTRVNRKSMHSGAVLPGLMNDDTVEVAVALDMSGSIGNTDAQAFLSEVKGILDQYQDYKIDLWCFDTEVYNHQTITQDNDQDFYSYELKGGGGTDFMANWKFMVANDIQPKKFVMFTDGHCWGDWGDPDWCDTLFLIKDNPTGIAPFGETIHYEKLV